MSESAQPVGISWSEVMATGFASTGAAVATSKFGVGGTIGGAGITAMLATVGAAILKSYFESPVGSTRETRGDQLPRVDRTRPPMVRFGRQLALDRRSTLVKGLIGAFLVFVVGMIQVTGVEAVIGNSFSCGFWGTCPLGAAPGPHIVTDRGTGAGFSILRPLPLDSGSPGGPFPPTTASPQPNPSTDSPQPDPSTSTAAPGASP